MIARLRQLGILGLNERNAAFIEPHNPRALFGRVDDKVVAKQLAARAGLLVPKTYDVIENFGDLGTLRDRLRDREDFVIKPVRGSMGNGVLVIRERDGEGFIQTGGQRLELGGLRHHLANILAGLHSLGGRPDHALIEERLTVHPVFERLAINGVPDLRLIVFRGVPVMAMLRLPTQRSGGRANLHQGAIGMGIDLRSGRTTNAICNGRPVTRHPDTGAALAGIELPFWAELLAMAARGEGAFGLGYLGLDLVIDATMGPVFLEANARPGLAIQIANGVGLKSRLNAIRDLKLEGTSVEERVRFAQSLA